MQPTTTYPSTTGSGSIPSVIHGASNLNFLITPDGQDWQDVSPCNSSTVRMSSYNLSEKTEAEPVIAQPTAGNELNSSAEQNVFLAVENWTLLALPAAMH